MASLRFQARCVGAGGCGQVRAGGLPAASRMGGPDDDALGHAEGQG